MYHVVAALMSTCFSHRERQLLHLRDGGELLHAGQDGFDSALGGEGNPPLVFHHEEVREPQCADHHVFTGRGQQLHQQLQHLIAVTEQTQSRSGTTKQRHPRQELQQPVNRLI